MLPVSGQGVKLTTRIREEILQVLTCVLDLLIFGFHVYTAGYCDNILPVFRDLCIYVPTACTAWGILLAST